ncbi:MAG: zinc ribbon domain-containing protein [Proteobacteria bacterium]|nr:zinc ribbon domain-containing protein [Pseudomonadota bacterium]
MPIYEYSCRACGHLEEILQKMSDPAPTACSQCGKGPVEKQMSLSSFALKGTGWYVTDFKGTAPPKPEFSSGSSPESSNGESLASAPDTSSTEKPGVNSQGAKSEGAIQLRPPQLSRTLQAPPHLALRLPPRPREHVRERGAPQDQRHRILGFIKYYIILINITFGLKFVLIK